MKGIALRPALPSDWACIARLLAANELPMEGAQDGLRSFIVAFNQAAVVGVAGLEIYGDVALLRSVAVRADHRRQGIGEALVQALMKQAASGGVSKMYLLTTAAATYFSRHGFCETSRAGAPVPLRASVQFNGVCPDSATLMSCELFIAEAPRRPP